LESLPTHCQGREQEAALFTLLSILGRNQLSELVRFGADLKVANLRQVVADVVIQLVGADEESLLTLLVTGEDEEAVIPLLALGRLNTPSCIEECLRRMGDTNATVREASLRAMRGQQSPRIRQEVLRCLKDEEPSIRIEALRYLSVYRDRVDLAMVEQVLLSERLSRFETNEVKAWVVAYGIIGRLGALKLLRSVLEGKVELAVPLAQTQGYCLQAMLSINSAQAQGALDLLGRKDPEMKFQIARLKAQGRRS
jgi:HEAT repeat protein